MYSTLVPDALSFQMPGLGMAGAGEKGFTPTETGDGGTEERRATGLDHSRVGRLLTRSDVVPNKVRDDGARGSWHVAEADGRRARHTKFVSQVARELELHVQHLLVESILILAQVRGAMQ